jgi:zinc protease
LEALLNARIGKWKAPPAAVPVPRYPKPSHSGLTVFYVDKPGAVQTTIRFITPAPPYSHPANVRYAALGELLGGTFTSRLNTNLREVHGYTYGAGAHFVMDPKVGYFIAVSDVRADVTGASIKEFLSEFKRIDSGDVTPAEVAKVKATMRDAVVASLSELGSLTGTAEEMALDGRSFAGLQQDLAQTMKLDAAELNRLAKGSIDTNRGVLILVGDKATILAQIKGLGLPEPVEAHAD